MAEEEQAADVIDKIADKLGMAVEKLTPLAETIVQEFRTAHIIMSISGFLVAGMILILGCKISKYIQKNGTLDKNEKSISNLACVLVVVIVMTIGFGIGIDNAVMALNPHYYLLKELMGSS